MSYTKQQIQEAIEAVEKYMPTVMSEQKGGVVASYAKGHGWLNGASSNQSLASCIGFQTKEEALKKIEEFEYLSDKLRKDWGIPRTKTALESMQGEIHNPQGVHSDKLPGGRRFLWKKEIGCLSFQRDIWRWSGEGILGWDKTGWSGNMKDFTYCVPIDFKD